MKKHIIIGASAAGIGAANALNRFDPESEIICIAKEAYKPYNTCFLADHLADEKTDQELLLPIEHIFSKPKRTLITGVTVEQIIPEEKKVVCSDGRAFTYDTLFLGAGYKPVQLFAPQEGKLQGYFSFYYQDDIERINRFLTTKPKCNAIVIGGGINGLECADALAKRGCNVTVVQRSHQLLSGMVSNTVAQFITQKMFACGVQLCANVTVQKIITQSRAVAGVQLSDGTQLAADLVVCSVGARPNSDLAQHAGLQTIDGAVVVNEYMQTSQQNIFAGGDVARMYDRLSETWGPNITWSEAMRQGMLAGKAMAGIPQKYDGANVIIESHFFGLAFSAAGPTAGEQFECTQEITQTSCTVLVSQNKKPRGFVLVGGSIPFIKAKRALLTQQSFSILNT